MESYAALPSLYLEAPGHSLNLLVEARLQRGLPRFHINGLKGEKTNEIADRIRNAIHASGIHLPHLSLSVNLSPVDLEKRGAYLDLSIAISILLALSESSGPINPLLSQSRQGKKLLYLGELSLSGRVLPVRGLHSLLWEARKQGFETVVLPRKQFTIAQLIPDLNFIPIERLGQLNENKAISIPKGPPIRIEGRQGQSQIEELSLSPRVQKAVALCAAGWHSLLLIGPPGSGKSSIAREILNLLPPPSPEEAIEILINQQGEYIDIESGKLESKSIPVFRPLRSPHHSLTACAMVGGGSPIKIGEVSRAHNGLLLLDELGEFSRGSLQSLREPLQEREIQISRSSHTLKLPARFLLCATSNPCPCGDLSKRYVSCACTDVRLKNYMSKFTGSLRDRIDIEAWVDRKDLLRNGEEGKEEQRNTEQRQKLESPQQAKTGPGSIPMIISRAHRIQNKRFADTHLRFNADIEAKDLENYIPLRDSGAQKEWKLLSNSSQINFRALGGIRRLARTLADLEDREEIETQDILEAASYRCLERIWS